jgi:hypothetical protein
VRNSAAHFSGVFRGIFAFWSTVGNTRVTLTFDRCLGSDIETEQKEIPYQTRNRRKFWKRRVVVENCADYIIEKPHVRRGGCPRKCRTTGRVEFRPASKPDLPDELVWDAWNLDET